MKLDKQWIRMSLVALTTGTMALACTVTTEADDDDGQGGARASGSSGQGSGQTGPGSSGSGNSFYCCLNGVGFTCPNDAAVVQCIGFDIDGCLLGCGFDDFDCQDSCFDQLFQSNPDPSACTEDAGVDCSDPTGGGPTGGGPTGGGGLCVGDWDGNYCDTDGDCSSNNCTNDKCYGNSEGNPCDTDGDCTSNNCYQNCCYGNGEGEPCDTDGDCSSNNCYQNECQ